MNFPFARHLENSCVSDFFHLPDAFVDVRIITKTDLFCSRPTLSAVSHASLRGLQQVHVEVSTVAHGDRDAEHAAFFAEAREELPGGAGRQLPHLQGPRQRLAVPQGQPDRRLSPAVVHLEVCRGRRTTGKPFHSGSLARLRLVSRFFFFSAPDRKFV